MFAFYLPHDEIHNCDYAITGQKPFKCPVCEKTYTKNSHAKSHFDIVHRGQKPFKCSMCDKTYSKKSHVRAHFERVHEGKKLPRCRVCSLAFNKEVDLQKHMELHNGKDSLQCFKCDATFLTKV